MWKIGGVLLPLLLFSNEISITIAPSSYFFNLDPGINYNSNFMVFNNGNIPYSIKFEVYDLIQGDDGKIEPIKMETNSLGCELFLKFPKEEFNIKPNEKRFFKYYIEMPEKIEGGYACAVKVSLILEKNLNLNAIYSANLDPSIYSKFYISTEKKEGNLNLEEVSVGKKEGEEGYFLFLKLQNMESYFSKVKGFYSIRKEKETIMEGKIDYPNYIFPKKLVTLSFPINEIKTGEYLLFLTITHPNPKPIIKNLRFEIK